MFYQPEIVSLSRQLIISLSLWYLAYSLEQVPTLVKPSDDLEDDINKRKEAFPIKYSSPNNSWSYLQMCMLQPGWRYLDGVQPW